MIPLHFTAMLGLLLVGWYVDYRVAPLLPSISCGDDDEANSRLPPTAVCSVDCTDGDDTHDVATAADNAASGATTDACSTANGDASAPESDVIAVGRGPSTSLSPSSSAVSVVRTSELAVWHGIGVDDTRLALPATVPEWVVTAVDIASEALAIVRGHHPYAELIRWTGLRSDAPFWQLCLAMAPFLLGLWIARYYCGGLRREGARVSITHPRFHQPAIGNVVRSRVDAPGTGLGRAAEHVNVRGPEAPPLTLRTILGISTWNGTPRLPTVNQPYRYLESGATRSPLHAAPPLTLRTALGISTGDRTPRLPTGNQRYRSFESAPPLTLRTALGISTEDRTHRLPTGNQPYRYFDSVMRGAGGADYRHWQREAAAITIQRWTRTEFRRWLVDAAERRSLERRIHEWLSHKERADQDTGNVVPASDTDQSDVDANDVAPRDRSVHPEGDVLRRPSNATTPPSGHQGNLVDDPARGVVPEAITARRRLPITLLRFEPPFDRWATLDPPFPNTRTRWPHH